MAANADDIRIGKGVVSFTNDEVEANLVDLGFVPNFDIAADITTKDYISAREGIGVIAKTFITALKSTIQFKIDSVTGANLRYFALAAPGGTDTDGNTTLVSLSDTSIEGLLAVEGTNTAGKMVDWIAKVSLRPTGTLSLITNADDFTSIPLEATVIQTETYGFGLYTVHDAGTV